MKTGNAESILQRASLRRWVIMATGIREADDAHGESDCLREALSELLTSLRDALEEPKHDSEFELRSRSKTGT